MSTPSFVRSLPSLGALPILASLVSGCAPEQGRISGPPRVDGGTEAWFFADLGEGILWDTVALRDGIVSFVPAGGDLGSAPLRDAGPLVASLSCGPSTRLVVGLQGGKVAMAETTPRAPCAERLARTMDWSGVEMGAMLAADTTHALVVLDLPGDRVAQGAR